MLRFARSFAVPSLDLAYQSLDIAHGDFRIRVERCRGIVFDEALVYPATPWSGYGDRPRVDVVLDGRVRDSENGQVRWLEAGGFAVGRALDSLYARNDADSFVLAIEYQLGSLGTSAPVGLPTGALSPGDLARLRDRADQLLSPAPERLAATPSLVADVLSCLRSAGLPFDAFRARDLVAPVPAPFQRVADALGQALSTLEEQPGTDRLALALDLSRRRVADLVSAVVTRYGLNGQDWRTMRDRFRTFTALMAASHPRATTELVARAVGYGSPNALCHAFRAAGFPSPGNVRAALARLS